MTEVISAPACAEDVADAMADALREGGKLAIRGGASKAEIGAPVEVRELPMTGLRGIVDYDPAELVLTVGAGTPLADVEALLAGSGQVLAFDPFDHGPIFGRRAGNATIGGVVAAGVSGSQRLSAGAVRDHLLGFRAVSGRGEIFTAGGKVVKNVTGFDLPKLAAGSWGRLFAMTEFTVKVLPRPRESATRMLLALDVRQAVQAMSAAMGSQAVVASAAHLPNGLNGGPSATILRLQGFGASVAARCSLLEQVLAPFGALQTPPQDEAEAMWEGLRTLSLLPAASTVWRMSVPAARACDAVAPLGGEARCLFDWAGGLVWVATEIEAQVVRAAAEGVGGHARLIRADAATRARVPAFHPPQRGVALLEERVRRAFDPLGVFETGRF